MPVTTPHRTTSGLGRYCGPAIETTTLPNGAVAAADLVENTLRIFATEPRLIPVTPQIHAFVGASIVNRIFIEGDDGVIVFDTGDDLADGERAYDALRSVTDKPVKAIVYSHNHYAHGSTAFVSDGAQPAVYGHPRVNANLSAQGFSTGGEFPEIVPVLDQRFIRQFGSALPTSGPDAGFASVIPTKSVDGSMPVTHPVEHGQEVTVAGVRMQFLIGHISDSDDTLTVWLPDHDAVLNNFLWPTLPNLYTLRGDQFRDPQSWRNGVRQIRALKPEHLLSTHALPISGRRDVGRVLDDYADAISFFVDQTLRGITRGLGPDELREFVRLPEHLRTAPHNAENYGELSYFPPYIYQHVFGWYDGEPAHINPAPRELVSRRTVEGFGGVDAVLTAVDRAVDDNELSWAAELVTHVLRIDSGHEQARRTKASILRELGQIAAGNIARHFYLSHALELEGKISIPTAVSPSAEDVADDPARYVDFQRIRLDPAASASVNTLLRVTVTDSATECGLHVRRGVAEFVPHLSRYPVEPGIGIALDAATWARIYVGELGVERAIDDGLIELSGERADVVAFFQLFDRP